MKKVNEDRINDWSTMADSVANIYLKIIECEKKNDLGDEYKDLLHLLPVALRLERDKFYNMGLDESNYRRLSIRFDISEEDIIDATDGYDTKFSEFRKHNYFMSKLNMEYNGFYRARETHGIADFINNQNELRTIQNEVYSENYHTQVTVNFIQMLDRYIKDIDDEDVKNYLIYIKYLMIATVPKYEEDYVLFGEKLLPIRNIINTFPVTEGYTEEEIKALIKQSLTRDIEAELESMLRINNFILPYHKRIVYKELALNKARLISLDNKDFIDEMREKTDGFMIKGNDFYSEINKLVRDMFDDAYSIVNKKDTKKVLK